MSIDRKALVSRHNPRLTEPNAQSPLSVGNGMFAFTADFTGLQSFLPTEKDAIHLCTQSQWGFHSYTDTTYSLKDFSYQYHTVNERPVPYMTNPEGQEALFTALRINPHRLNLARIAFVQKYTNTAGNSVYRELPKNDTKYGEQFLDLWEACIHSSFSFLNSPVSCTSVVHPDLDLLGIQVKSPLLSNGELAIRISFPYGSELPDASDWNSPDKHESLLKEIAKDKEYEITRRLDTDEYRVRMCIGVQQRLKQISKHEFILESATSLFQASFLFSREHINIPLPSFEDTKASVTDYWASFWNNGAAIELAESKDSRGFELERRIILSQYLTAIHCTGVFPPQETGLCCNSWYGKFHLEMHLWHAAHFVLWGRAELFMRSMSWYTQILESARERARSQGYRGARWPKMTDPSGAESPSPIGPYLCWQQPHPIMYAELIRRAGKLGDKEAEYAELVFETADFMASYLCHDKKNDVYYLGPPLIPAQESHKPGTTKNPTFEIEYWYWALNTAVDWAERLQCCSVNKQNWQDIIQKLVLPATGSFDSKEVYLAHEECPDTFEKFAKDHPSMLLAYGLLPGGRINPACMSDTLDAVISQWDFESSWGWDFPVMAMTAARLGRRNDVIDLLLMDSPKNTYRPDGHNAQLAKVSGPSGTNAVWSTALPLYLPGNGSLLLAVAMMAGSWDGAADSVMPGFPDDGSWTVSAEGFIPFI